MKAEVKVIKVERKYYLQQRLIEPESKLLPIIKETDELISILFKSI